MSFMGPGLKILGQRAAPLVGRLKRISAEDEEAEVEEEKEKEKEKEKKKEKNLNSNWVRDGRGLKTTNSIRSL